MYVHNETFRQGRIRENGIRKTIRRALISVFLQTDSFCVLNERRRMIREYIHIPGHTRISDLTEHDTEHTHVAVDNNSVLYLDNGACNCIALFDSTAR